MPSVGGPHSELLQLLNSILWADKTAFAGGNPKFQGTTLMGAFANPDFTWDYDDLGRIA